MHCGGIVLYGKFYNIDLFDGIVIYTGECSTYNLSTLRQQYMYHIKKRRIIENKLNNRRYVELPYSGSQPYIFISYSHKDKNDILPILASLQRKSFRIWYDDGIGGGENWRKIIADKIEHCECLLLFSSQNSTRSDEVAIEINGALLCKKKIILVKSDDSSFSLELNMILTRFNYLYTSAENFQEKLIDSLPYTTREK